MKKNILITGIILIAAVFFIYKFFLGSTSEFSIAPGKFEELTKEKDVIILDVRSKFEFGGDKIAGAQNISYTASDFKQRIEKLDKDKTYLVYCATGSRSSGACKEIKGLGFTKIYNLTGGIEHWKSDGKPVVR